ncbi:MAG: class II aldolase/adducin family protein [Phycisphaerales bacterium]|nr:class II aldolase/adducin family protein [Phycisphaerales bacterium]
MGLPFPIDLYDSISSEICRVGERMWRQGFCAGSDGNISARLDDDLIIITPSGVSKGDMRSDSMCVVRVEDGSLIHGPHPSSERAVHLAVYRARHDVEAVIHSHAPRSTAWACTGEPLPEAVHPEAELLLGRIPIVPYVTPGTGLLAEATAEALTSHTAAMLLGNHGTVTLGDSLETALARLEMLESYCRLVIELSLLGKMRRLSETEMADLLKVKREMWGLGDDRD